MMFPISNQAFLEKRGSDHRLVLISMVASKEVYKGSFRFDKRFLNKPLVKETIADCWNKTQRSGVVSVTDRLREVRKGLSLWKKN